MRIQQENKIAFIFGQNKTTGIATNSKELIIAIKSLTDVVGDNEVNQESDLLLFFKKKESFIEFFKEIEKMKNELG